MRRIKVEVEGAHILPRLVEMMSYNLPAYTERNIRKLTGICEYLLNINVPVGNTGKLRDSIDKQFYYDEDGVYGEVKPDIYYAAFVDRGTTTSKGRFIPRKTSYPHVSKEGYPGFRIGEGYTRGQVGQHFMEKTYQDLLYTYTDEIIDDILNYAFDI